MVNARVCGQGHTGNITFAGDHVDHAGRDVCQQAKIRLRVSTNSSAPDVGHMNDNARGRQLFMLHARFEHAQSMRIPRIGQSQRHPPIPAATEGDEGWLR